MQTGIAARTKSWIIIVLLALVSLFAAYVFWLKPQPNNQMPSQQDRALTQAINDCDGITEKAALDLPPAIVEFQKLEYAGRKARVFRLCMTDRGYQEDKKWTEYAQPVVAQTAKASKISVDEAIENMRREDMVRFMPSSDTPAYWAKMRQQ